LNKSLKMEKIMNEKMSKRRIQIRALKLANLAAVTNRKT